jgi:hypothetical protein
LFAVAAVAAGLATTGSFGFLAGRSDGIAPAVAEPMLPAGSRTVEGWNSETEVAGTAVLTPAAWGTGIKLHISGAQKAVAPGTGCVLIALSNAGATGKAASWAIPVSSPQSDEEIGGSTAIPLHQLSELLVVTDYGEQLLSVSVA